MTSKKVSDFASSSHNHTLASLSEKSYNSLDDKPSIPSAYTLPVASDSVLGGVKQGSNISIDANGGISPCILDPGDVVGPSSSTADNIVLFNGATGKIIKDSTKKTTDFAKYISLSRRI